MSSVATAPDRRTALGDALLDADMNVRYWIAGRAKKGFRPIVAARKAAASYLSSA